ncbi:hypothetical protein [Sorangium sp. So ce1024]|uniref:hypothetical protein n=1 Tax=unclassified Sorangium TaxID=2621164 RepID=UPI003F102D1D
MQRGPTGFPHFQELPEELQARIIQFATPPRRADELTLTNRLVSRFWRETVDRLGFKDELWYGLNSEQRLTSFLDPFELKSISLGEFQEGPCRGIAKKLVEWITSKYGDEFPSCMLGVLYTECGKVMLTLSGTLSLRTSEGKKKREALLSANKAVMGGKALVVTTGAVGVVGEHGCLYGNTVFNFNWARLKKDFYPAGKVGKETANTIPGTCALPKLIAKCQEADVVPRWVCEVLIRPRRGASGIDVLGLGGCVQTFAHGEPVPSCLNCRTLVPLMLEGVERRRAEQQKNEAREAFLLERAQRIYQLEEQARAEKEAERLKREEACCLLVEGCVSARLGAQAWELLGDAIHVLFDEQPAMIASAVEDLEKYVSDAAVIGDVLAKRFVTNIEGAFLREAFAVWERDQPKLLTRAEKKKADGQVDAFLKRWTEGFNLECVIASALCDTIPGLDELTSPQFYVPVLRRALEDACKKSVSPKPWNPEQPRG